MIYQMTEFARVGSNAIGTKVKRAVLNLRARLVMADSQLIDLARSGDDQAFGELLKRHQDFIYRLAWGYLRDSDGARDVTQEVFLKAYTALPYFRTENSFPGWLFKICRNQCLNILRRRKLESAVEIDSPGASIQNGALKLRVQRLIEKLPGNYKDAIILRYYDNLKYEQIARVLGVDMGVVKIRLHRAKQMLKDMVKEAYDEVL
jgi:RNA polymerase sigma-70 factor (ECF subfamily)